MTRSTGDIITSCDVSEAIEEIHKAECGAHYMIFIQIQLRYAIFIPTILISKLKRIMASSRSIHFMKLLNLLQTLAEKYNDGMNELLKREE